MTSLRASLAKFLAIAMICSMAAPAFAQRRRSAKASVTPVATSIVFKNADNVEISEAKIEGKTPVRVTATVLDQKGNAMSDAEVTWVDVPQVADFPLSFARSITDANTLIITAKGGDAAVQQRVIMRIRATFDDAKGDLSVKFESTPKPVPAKITFDHPTIDLKSDEDATIVATLKDSDDKSVKGSKVTWELAKPELSEFVRLGTVVNDDKTNSITILGRPGKKGSKPPDVITLVGTSGNAVGIVAINYKAPETGHVAATWSVLPPKIAGDLFGRTITNDYFCIEVAIDNHSDSDIALGSLRFQPEGATSAIPTSHYPVVQGSLARRKITHPRGIVLAAISSLGTLMTGFNPFFHNINHAKNYAQFVTILSNPVEKGVEAVWQDPYPIEMANFSAIVLKDDKIITKDSKTFKTIVFVEKRNVYQNGDKDRKDPIAVKKKLGRLIVEGQEIQQSGTRDLTQ